MVSEIFPHLGRARRQDGVHPLGLHRVEQPLAGPVHDEHRPAADGRSRASARGSPTAWGARTRDLPGLRRDERPQGPRAAQGPARPTGARASCPGVYQGTHLRPTGDADRQPGAPGRHDRRGQQRSQLDLVKQLNAAPPASSCRPRASWRRGSRASSWPTGCSRPPPRRSTSTAEPEHIQRLYGLDDPALRALRPAVPDGPAAGRARRALRADLFGRHGEPALLGRPHRHQGQPRAVRRRDRQAGRRRCWPTWPSAGCSTRRW